MGGVVGIGGVGGVVGVIGIGGVGGVGGVVGATAGMTPGAGGGRNDGEAPGGSSVEEIPAGAEF